MVLNTLKFIKQLSNQNITTYVIKKLKENEQEVYDELIKKIRYVGDKITTLYLREICWMFNIKPKDYLLIFPVDTWVKQIINRLGILNEGVLSNEKLKKIKELEVKKEAVNVCLKYHIDPIKFNAGIWYIGTHSLEIVLNNLEKISM